MGEAEQAVARRREAWKAVVEAGDVDAYADLVTEDLVWLPPRGAPIQGRAAFRAWLEPFFERFTYGFHVQPREVHAFDGWSVEAGTFSSTLTPRGGGEAQRHEGRYTVLWRLDGDGAWRIERYVDGFPRGS